MVDLNRRAFLVSAAASTSACAVPRIVQSRPGRRVLELVYDKGMGMMRAVERIVY